jgi:hypothetical protein
MDLKRMSENLKAKATGAGYSNSTEDPGDGAEAEGGEEDGAEESGEKAELKEALADLEKAKALLQKCLSEH